jgi:hypothetical protein
MKTIRNINKIAFYTTLILFATIYVGLIAQILLGIIQLISALILTNKFYNKSQYAKTNLSIYWIVTIIEIILLYSTANSIIMSDSFIISLFVYAIFSMGIATYFLIIMTKITYNHENLSQPNPTL